MIAEGKVAHARPGLHKNQFSYPIFYLFFPITAESELKSLLRQKFWNVLSLKNKTYLGGNAEHLAISIKQFLKEHCSYDGTEIWLQTLPSMFGYVFNPVSFWICKKEGRVDAVLCEVRNTFGEKHFYWIKSDSGFLQENQWFTAQKVFHVSPFFPVEGHYKFRFQFTKTNFRIHINYHRHPDGDDQQILLSTSTSGSLRQLSSVSLPKLLWNYGWMTPLVVFRIHYQALRLFLKKAKFHKKPEPPQSEVTS